MKCHAGVEFPSGKPCPKCNANLGEVCWPGINADLLKLAQLRKAMEGIQTIAECALVGPKRDQESNLSSIATYARAALATLTPAQSQASENKGGGAS